MPPTPTLTTNSIKQLWAQCQAQWEEEDRRQAKEDKLFKKELVWQAEEERKRLEEEKQQLEAEERKKLEEVEKAYEAQLQEEKHQREKEKWKASVVDKDTEREPSGSDKMLWLW
jgi:hypothetical protein